MKTDNTPHRVRTNGRRGLFFLLVGSLLLASANLCLAAGGEPRRYQENGVLTAVEGKSAVTINAKGYELDPSVLVENAAGKPISLNRLPIPSYVAFEYSYMLKAPKTMAPVIMYIKETKRPAGNKRSPR
ncbi:MAG: hypothetical protein NT087_03125 [Deltaproteobacteria bacterium]|nr:hypothetical protein [Deltaproteobacteria bacterium]